MPHIRDPVTGLCVVCDRGKRPVPFRQSSHTAGIPEPCPHWSRIQEDSRIRKEQQMIEKEERALKIMSLEGGPRGEPLYLDAAPSMKQLQNGGIPKPSQGYHNLAHTRSITNGPLSSMALVKDPENFTRYSLSRHKAARRSLPNDLNHSPHTIVPSGSPHIVYVPVYAPGNNQDDEDMSWFEPYAIHNANLYEPSMMKHPSTMKNGPISGPRQVPSKTIPISRRQEKRPPVGPRPPSNRQPRQHPVDDMDSFDYPSEATRWADYESRYAVNSRRPPIERTESFAPPVRMSTVPPPSPVKSKFVLNNVPQQGPHRSTYLAADKTQSLPRLNEVARYDPDASPTEFDYTNHPSSILARDRYQESKRERRIRFADEPSMQDNRRSNQPPALKDVNYDSDDQYFPYPKNEEKGNCTIL